MIRSEGEYQDSLRQRAYDLDSEAPRRTALAIADALPKRVEQIIARLLAADAPPATDLDWYEAVRQVEEFGDLFESQVYRVLIALGPSAILSHRELCLSKSTLARNDADECGSISVDRAKAKRIVEAMGASRSISFHLNAEARP
jgi:hypothetical protein